MSGIASQTYVLQHICHIFAVFDKDRSGFASSSEIKTVMANLGVHFSDEEIQEMMIEVRFIDFLPLFALTSQSSSLLTIAILSLMLCVQILLLVN